MEDRWSVACDLTGSETVKRMVLSFLERCPVDQFLDQASEAGSRPSLEDLVAHRFTDSYMNHVIRVRFRERPDKGFIIKLAPPCMQCPGVALQAPAERGEMEYRAFGFFSSIVPGCVPTPVFYDRDLRILCTRELTEHRCLTEELLNGRYSLSGARSLAASLASVHAATHILSLGTDGLAQLRHKFPTLESMVDLIRIFHYERPFDPADPGKRCAKDVLLRLDDVYKDVTVMAAKERVKQQFAESVECLIHGDLHIDSVIASGDDFKMVDAEFVRLGPCAYDMGLLLATLVLVYHHHKHVLEHQDDMQGHDLDCSLKTTAAEKKHEGQEAAGDFEQENGGPADTQTTKVLAMISEMLQTYTGSLKEKLMQDDHFAANLVRDIAAFAGCEILSCVIGPSHFDFMDSSPAAQVDCVRTAIAVLHNLDRVTSVPELVHVIAT
ncbi:hypothetical protein BaRGS_00032924 [Batillaria attramentaria]|uniref:Aminoglycoside phosphotransferase domain-containing protein n=1 Tax=Batillaria attramentaria TaxID=370345 RepID=A0ABD0JM27_9CAEN